MFKNLKPKNIPLIVTAYGALVALIGTWLGLRALITPEAAIGYVTGAEMIAGGWAGRTLGLGLLVAAALWLRDARAYALAFLACTCREIGDIAGALHSGEAAMVPVLSGFLAADLIALALSLRAARAA